MNGNSFSNFYISNIPIPIHKEKTISSTKCPFISFFLKKDTINYNIISFKSIGLIHSFLWAL
jgi:hypothetical protein